MVSKKRIVAAALLSMLLIPFQNCGSKADLSQYGATSASSTSPKKPVIDSVVNPTTVNIFDPVGLSVSASGEEPLTYQWYKDGAPIANATKSFLVIPEALTVQDPTTKFYAKTGTNKYVIEVKDKDGEMVSQELVLNIGLSATQEAFPSITGKTADFQRQTCAANANQSTVAINVTATGTRLTYQWKYNYVDGSTLSDVLSTTSATLNPPLIPVDRDQNGRVDCRVIYFGDYVVTATDAFGRFTTATVKVAANNI